MYLSISNATSGHAASWCKGYPEICPSTTCLQPLDPSSNLTFPLITSLLSECTGADVSQPTGEFVDASFCFVSFADDSCVRYIQNEITIFCVLSDRFCSSFLLVYQHDLKKASAGRAAVASPSTATTLTKPAKTTTLPASAAAKAAAVARAQLDKKKEQESLFPYSLLHLGGDEVSYTCWEQSPQVQPLLFSFYFICGNQFCV